MNVCVALYLLMCIASGVHTRDVVQGVITSA